MLRSHFCLLSLTILLFLQAVISPLVGFDDKPADSLKLEWKDNFLTIRGKDLPGDEMRVMYLEAYCRPGSTDRDWGQTVIGHKTELISASEDGRWIKLRCTLNDGVIVDHEIRATDDEVDFRLTAKNPTDKESLAHWAQPCIRVDKFTGATQADYFKKGFIFLDGKLAMMPTPNWATKARYVPGQVWAPKGVDRNDVNPRPLSDDVPSSGLIGCYSADGKWIMATAFQPYQELFQGVAVCLHSDFRIGGLRPREQKNIRGKIYLVPAHVDKLLARYARDFPEQHAANEQSKQARVDGTSESSATRCRIATCVQHTSFNPN